MLLNTLPYHAKGHGLEAAPILHHLGAKMNTKIVKRDLKGFNEVLGKGEKGEDTFGQVQLNSLKARE